MVVVNLCGTRSRRRNWPARTAITVVEVMFAMLVAVIGLLGIASLLPLAARNARESNGFNFVHSAGGSWYQEFSARGLNDFATWRALRDFQVGVANVGFSPMRHDPSITAVGAPPLPTINADVGFNAPYATPSHSGISSLPVNRVWVNQSICIDPYFFTDPVTAADITNAIAGGVPFAANHGAYRPAVFPYYQDGHNPVTDAFDSKFPWPDQPRMLRVTLDAPMSSAAPNLRQVTREFAQMIFTSNDDFSAFVDEKQSEIPAVRLFLTTAGTVPTFVKAVSDRKYSWLATLSPRATTSLTDIQREYTLSIAIFQGRDLGWIDSSNLSPGLVDNKPSGERLVWVSPLSGPFTGGNGGRVRIISNAASDDRLTIGDWIMLGKHEWLAASPLNRSSTFGWFRIVAVDAEATKAKLSAISTAGDPFGNATGEDVWSRDVVLEGPDWDFGASSAGLQVGPTTGTLMKNVITVIDRSTIVP